MVDFAEIAAVAVVGTAAIAGVQAIHTFASGTEAGAAFVARGVRAGPSSGGA